MASFYQLSIDSTFPYLSIVSVFGKDLAFYRFESITIPESVTDIGDLMPVTGLGIVMLAKDLQAQRHLTIPKTVTNIEPSMDVTGMGIVGIVVLAKDLQCAKIPDNSQDGDEHRIFNWRHGHGDSRDSHARQQLAMCKGNWQSPRPSRTSNLRWPSRAWGWSCFSPTQFSKAMSQTPGLPPWPPDFCHKRTGCRLGGGPLHGWLG